MSWPFQLLVGLAKVTQRGGMSGIAPDELFESFDRFCVPLFLHERLAQRREDEIIDGELIVQPHDFLETRNCSRSDRWIVGKQHCHVQDGPRVGR